jgi:putative ABC transport system ATP-binding protein
VRKIERADDEPDDCPLLCEGLVKVYRADTGEVHALRGVDARFPAGSVTAVVGPSGSGKSSLLRLLGALDQPTAGRVRIAGHVVDGRVRHRRKLRRELLATVLQRPSDNLFGNLDVRDHLLYAAQLGPATWSGRPPTDARVILGEVLDAIGLAERTRNRPAELSGGEQQRLAIGMAIARRAPIVLADEPTSELDSATTQLVLDLLQAAAAEGRSVVVASHDERLTAHADQVLAMRDGALAQKTVAGGNRHVVIDSTGRLPLPQEVLERFPDNLADLTIEEDRIVIRPPETGP